jgi:hypothetical protein
MGAPASNGWNIWTIARFSDGGQNSNSALLFDTGATGATGVRGFYIAKNSQDFHIARFDSTANAAPAIDVTVLANGNVGIGTTGPAAKLDLWGSDTSAPHFITRHSTGVYAAQLYPYNGSSLLSLRDAAAWDEKVRISSTGPTGFNGGNVGIGTTNPGSYKLALEGTIGAREVVVTSSSWADHVFRSGYRLSPLSEVNAYIQANHHLPDIPTEAEVKERGVSVAEMQAKLLAKIEELTLRGATTERPAALSPRDTTCGQPTSTWQAGRAGRAW